MNKYLLVGEKNRLKINRYTDNGVYLICEDKDEVLLPNQYVSYAMKEGDEIDVKLIGMDPKTNKLKLSRKVLLPKPEGYVERERRPRGERPERGERHERHGRPERKEE